MDHARLLRLDGGAGSVMAPASLVIEAEGPRRVMFGYNHQIAHKGRLYHVQSEDSGRTKSHIFTHVFHAGVIMASSRVDYGDDAHTNDILSRLEKEIGILDMDNIKQTLETIDREVAGSLAVALVDYESGMCLGTCGTGLNVDVAAAGNMEVMKAKSRVMRDLGIKGGIEDILITLESQYHIIRPVGAALFFYLAIDRERGNLALARHKLAAAAASVKV